MGNKFSSGKHAIAECDMCGFQFKLNRLREIVANDLPTGLLVCSDCWVADHPQNRLGRYPVNDPQAVRNARPDKSIPESRNIQWGWNPVGATNNGLTPNDLLAHGSIGTVTVEVTAAAPE